MDSTMRRRAFLASLFGEIYVDLELPVDLAAVRHVPVSDLHRRRRVGGQVIAEIDGKILPLAEVRAGVSVKQQRLQHGILVGFVDVQGDLRDLLQVLGIEPERPFFVQPLAHQRVVDVQHLRQAPAGQAERRHEKPQVGLTILHRFLLPLPARPHGCLRT